MSESEKVVVTEELRKVTFGYTKKENLGNYSNHEASVYVTDFVPKSAKNILKWVEEKREPALDELKQTVWAALDLDFEFTELGRPVLVKVAPPTPAPPASAPQQAPVPAPVPPAQAPRAPGQTPSVAQPFVHAETPAFCRDCGAQGLEAFWDNRTQNDEKQQRGEKIGPDFKCKTCNGGNGPNKQGRATPIYRPGSYEYNQKIGAAPAAVTPPAPAEPPF